MSVIHGVEVMSVQVRGSNVQVRVWSRMSFSVFLVLVFCLSYGLALSVLV